MLIMQSKNMVKSLGDYNKEQSSSSNIKNIKWTQKDPTDTDKSKTKKKIKKKISPSNIIPQSKNKKEKEKIEKVYKIEGNSEENKKKKELLNRKFEKSSSSNSKIEQGFKRPGR